jgi:quinolinate synthase
LSPKKALQAERIRELTRILNGEILSHYYARKEVKDLSAFVGGSRSIRERATLSRASVLVVCAVDFVVRDVRRARPDLRVLAPRADSLCPLSAAGTAALLRKVKERLPGAILCATPKTLPELTRLCDIIPEEGFPPPFLNPPPSGSRERELVFFPELKGADGRVPEALRDLSPVCRVHAQLERAEAEELLKTRPGSELLANSLCLEELRDLPCFSGDADALARRAGESGKGEFIVASEVGLAETLRERHPEKLFHDPPTEMFCPSMKLVNIKDILAVLEDHASRAVRAAGPPAAPPFADDFYDLPR